MYHKGMHPRSGVVRVTYDAQKSKDSTRQWTTFHSR